jgi:hypothetical protein
MPGNSTDEIPESRDLRCTPRSTQLRFQLRIPRWVAQCLHHFLMNQQAGTERAGRVGVRGEIQHHDRVGEAHVRKRGHSPREGTWGGPATALALEILLHP